MSWQPILTGELAERALARARRVVDELRAAPLGSDPSFARGHAGFAVLYAHAERVWPGNGYRAAAESALDAAFDQTTELELDHSLFGGFTGVAFAAELDRDADSDDPNEGIDEMLLESLAISPPWRGPFDLIGGLVGVGVYLLERCARSDAARAGVARIVDHLAHLAVAQPSGLAWQTPASLLSPEQAEVTPDGHLDLGVAHGAAGVAAWMARAATRGEAMRDTASSSCEGAIAWVLSQRMPNGHFPGRIAQASSRETRRAAWCYGTLGTAMTLSIAARETANVTHAARALELARAAAAQTPEAGEARDAGLCHGSVGAAHLFHRLYRATGDASLHDAALRWYVHAIAFDQPAGIGGYAAWRPSTPGGPWAYVDTPGLLEGSTGVALALIAAATGIEPSWDRALLMS